MKTTLLIIVLLLFYINKSIQSHYEVRVSEEAVNNFKDNYMILFDHYILSEPLRTKSSSEYIILPKHIKIKSFNHGDTSIIFNSKTQKVNINLNALNLEIEEFAFDAHYKDWVDCSGTVAPSFENFNFHFNINLMDNNNNNNNNNNQKTDDTDCSLKLVVDDSSVIIDEGKVNLNENMGIICGGLLNVFDFLLGIKDIVIDQAINTLPSIIRNIMKKEIDKLLPLTTKLAITNIDGIDITMHLCYKFVLISTENGENGKYLTIAANAWYDDVNNMMMKQELVQNVMNEAFIIEDVESFPTNNIEDVSLAFYVISCCISFVIGGFIVILIICGRSHCGIKKTKSYNLALQSNDSDDGLPITPQITYL